MGNIAVRLALLGTLGGLLGCGGGGGGPSVAGGPNPVPLPPDARLDSVFVLESGGAPPDDTTAVIPAGQRRIVVLRRGPPDNSLFARVTVAPAPAERRLTISPRPGVYGVDIAGEVGPGLELVVSYALHFVAPTGARTRYGSDLAFERALHLAQVHPDGRVSFLRTTRLGSDLVQAALPGPGRFVVAAPRR